MKKAFVRDLAHNKKSQPAGLSRTMEAAKNNIVFNHGPFTVIKGSIRHPGLSRNDALNQLRTILVTIGVGIDVHVRNIHGTIVFHVRRVATQAYDNPFRDADYTAARIDAGVDYCLIPGGKGPVYALGKAKIINRGNPSGTSVFSNDMPVYQLLEGVYKNKYVFCDEHIRLEAGYNDGDIVDSNTVLYHMYGCIEIGWSDGPPNNGSIAWNSGKYSEGQLSAYGDNFNQLLVSTGAKAGLRLGRKVSGSLPNGWPKF
jgi:hypothetical protein